eukprot:6237010-Prymnesium_polylepis.1
MQADCGPHRHAPQGWKTLGETLSAHRSGPHDHEPLAPPSLTLPPLLPRLSLAHAATHDAADEGGLEH